MATASTKVSQPWAKQLSVKYSQVGGPSLTHEVEPTKKVGGQGGQQGEGGASSSGQRPQELCWADYIIWLRWTKQRPTPDDGVLGLGTTMSARTFIVGTRRLGQPPQSFRARPLPPSRGLQVSLKSTVGVKARDLKVVAEVKPGKVAG